MPPRKKIEYLDANLCNLVHSGEIFHTCIKGKKWQLHVQKKSLKCRKKSLSVFKTGMRSVIEQKPGRGLGALPPEAEDFFYIFEP